MTEKKKHKGYHGPAKPLSEAEKRALTGLDLERERSKSSGRSGWGCMLVLVLIGAFCAGLVAFVIWWHPWETRSSQVPTTSSLCAEDERAMQFREQFLVLGYEVSDKRKGVVCVGPE